MPVLTMGINNQADGHRLPTGGSAIRLTYFGDPGWGFRNMGSLPIFVPTATWGEFSSVISNHPSFLYVYDCEYQVVDFGAGSGDGTLRASRFCCQNQYTTGGILYGITGFSGTTATFMCCFRDIHCQRYYWRFGENGPVRSLCCTGGKTITSSWIDEGTRTASITCC
jgi:hypothetical protein